LPRSIVTGGAGFVGSHLCDRLFDAGHEVVCIDNLSTGNRSNIAHLLGHRSFSFFDQDLCRPLNGPFDADFIFHLASPASPDAYLRMPVQTAMVNALGTQQMLERSRSSGARFLLASTSEAYGDPLTHPQREDYWGNVNPVGSRSCYDEGKRFAESLAMVYHRTYGVDVRIVRIFNTYGPRSDPADGRMIPNFVRQSLLNLPTTIYGEGSQTRSLCYVDDLVNGLLAAAFAPASNGEIFNLGSPEEHTVREYADLIRGMCGSSAPIAFHEAREDEPARRRPDIAKATALLGWTPLTTLHEGLEATIGWFRERLREDLGNMAAPAARTK
jgi:nucleoside-diphosphate-sugar epimerase